MGPHFGQAIPMMGMFFTGTILAIAAIGAVLVIIVRTIKGNGSQESRKSQADEAMMIQEIYQGLSQMEKRVETLETILLEMSKKDQKP